MDRAGDTSVVENSCLSTLAIAQRLLARQDRDPLEDGTFLHELTEAFHAEGAGWVEPGGRTERCRLALGEPALPWADDLILLLQAVDSLTPLLLSHDGHQFLCAAAGTGRVIWVGMTQPADWTGEEEAAFALIAQALGRRLLLDDAKGPHAGQERMENAVLVARRLAHVYSNVLTSILGFVEMSLSQVTAQSTLKRYLDVAFQGAQQGVQLTQRLRLLGCRATSTSQGVMLLPALTRQVGRRTSIERKVEEILDVPGDLPAVALSGEQVTAILDALLDNAHEALERGGRVTVAVRVVTPSAEEMRTVWGRMQPGPYVRLDISDNGSGLGTETRLRLFREPFFSLKPRHHGLGLTIVHSIVSSQQGGVCLLDNPTGGVTARVYLPVFAPTGIVGANDRRDQR